MNDNYLIYFRGYFRKQTYKQLTVVIQHDLVEHPPRGFSALIPMHDLRAQLLEGQGVSDGLARGLNRELVVDVADAEPLAVDGADGDAPSLFGHSGQLRNVGSGGSVEVALQFVVEQSDALAETLEFGDDEVVAEDFSDQGQISFQNVSELVEVERDRFQGRARLRFEFV